VKALLSASLLLAVAAAPGSAQSAAVEEELDALRSAFSAALVASDGETVASMYTDDGVLLPPGREIRGKDRIGRYFTTGRDYVQVAHSMIPDEVDVDGNTAYEIGRWSSTTRREGQGEVTASDRYLLVWRRGADGRWRIVYDMWHR
jgi:uncharacterized protein (TIGR02246 family)